MSSPDLVKEFERQVLSKLPGAGIKAAKAAAPELAELARASWDSGETPFGAPFVGKAGRPLTLHRSGELEDSESFIPIGNKILVRVTAPYARYQLKHGFLPQGGSIPQSWEAAIAHEAEQALEEAVK
jgi:hypothetical protein